MSWDCLSYLKWTKCNNSQSNGLHLAKYIYISNRFIWTFSFCQSAVTRGDTMGRCERENLSFFGRIWCFPIVVFLVCAVLYLSVCFPWLGNIYINLKTKCAIGSLFKTLFYKYSHGRFIRICTAWLHVYNSFNCRRPSQTKQTIPSFQNFYDNRFCLWSIRKIIILLFRVCLAI